jgi:type I restriction enzyme S subunit
MAVFNIQHTGVSRFQYTAFKNHTELSIPDLPTQQKIAAILSAYDELIENNKRRIALLEKMAEEIYREWFVRFRFPGHEKVKLIKGVPDGWKVEELRAVAIEASRSTRPGSHLAERFYLPLDLLTSKQMLPSGHLDYTEAQSSLVTFEKGDVLFGAMRPYLHKVAIAPFPGITRTTCFVIRPKAPQAWSWLFLTLFQPCSVDFATMICNGSDRPYTVWNKGMERMKVFRPDDRLLAKFEETVRPVLDSITSMYFVQLKLINCRDMLLPRLISGKLSVENLDIHFPPGMAEELKAEPTAAAHA